MNHLLGKNFTFAVLDDVLMSVDAGHRRQVCTLLKDKFPNTQFVFTTHDEIWLRHMKSEGLIKGQNFAHFRTWTVDLGPTEWDDRDIWSEIETYLARGDVRSAAALLRYYLEHFAMEACDRLRAKVEFRGDAQFVLSDLLPNATSALGDLLKRAKVAANSWAQKEVMGKVEALEAAFAEAKLKTNYDNWQVNAAVHFNAWANLRKEDFASVVTAFRAFTDLFCCGACREMYFVSPNRGNKEALRCACGALNLNLLQNDHNGCANEGPLVAFSNFQALEPDSANLARELVDYADSQRSAFMSFVLVWMAFNGWMASVTQADTDAAMIRAFAVNKRLIETYKLLMDQSPLFRDQVNSLKAMWPILNVRDVRKKLGRDAFLRYSRDDLLSECERNRVKLEPRNWSDDQLPSWEQLLRSIYLVRCNMFHGVKSPQNHRDRELVLHADRILRAFIQETGCFAWHD
jgi:hypothetical protein